MKRLHAWIAVGLLLASPARAEDPKREAHRLVRDARALFDRGDYAPAAAKFEQAFRLFPVAKMLYNLGITWDALARPAPAQCALERFLAEVADADPAVRVDAEQRVARLKGGVARIEVQAPPQTLLRLDGEEQVVAGTDAPRRTVCTTAGKHQIVAEKRGVSPLSFELEVAAGGTAAIELDPIWRTARIVDGASAAAPSVPASAMPAPSGAASAGMAEGSRPAWRRWWLWTAVGVAAGLVVVTSIAVAARPENVTPPASDYGPFSVLGQ